MKHIILIIITILTATGCVTTMKDGKEYYVITIPTPVHPDPVVVAGQTIITLACAAQPERRGCK